MIELATSRGPARVHVHPADEPVGAVVLGHGAGGGVGARDLVAVTEAAIVRGFTVALVEQPYRVAGRRSPAPAHQLDEAWTEVVAALREGELGGLPVVTGGRSSGARVACRTAAATGAVGIICLAFPLHPPGRPEKSRAAELDGVAVPALVIQGESDPFGMPKSGRRRTVVVVAGNHSLTSDLAAVAGAAGRWLERLTRAARHGSPA
jgi:predicted alpha/beta-hydrolase family hydrolase